MIAVSWATQVIPLVVLVALALAVVAYLVVTRVFGDTRAGRHAAHFLDAGEGDFEPSDAVKFKNQHPGAGGHG